MSTLGRIEILEAEIKGINKHLKTIEVIGTLALFLALFIMFT